MDYIYTFFSHFGAVRFNKECKKRGLNSALMPVPRSLSSSCGTCCKISGIEDENELNEFCESLDENIKDEIEQLWKMK